MRRKLAGRRQPARDKRRKEQPAQHSPPPAEGSASRPASRRPRHHQAGDSHGLRLRCCLPLLFFGRGVRVGAFLAPRGKDHTRTTTNTDQRRRQPPHVRPHAVRRDDGRAKPRAAARRAVIGAAHGLAGRRGTSTTRSGRKPPGNGKDVERRRARRGSAAQGAQRPEPRAQPPPARRNAPQRWGRPEEAGCRRGSGWGRKQLRRRSAATLLRRAGNQPADHQRRRADKTPKQRKRSGEGKDAHPGDARQRTTSSRPAPWGAVPPATSVRLAPLHRVAATQRKPWISPLLFLSLPLPFHPPPGVPPDEMPHVPRTTA